MDSITKARISDNEIRELFRKAFGYSMVIDSIDELKDGYFNTAYLIKSKDSFRTILKIAPPKTVKLMRYEKDIMRAEVDTLNMIKKFTDVPVPKVYFYDNSGDIIANEYFLMEYISGTPLNKLNNSLSEGEKSVINHQLGIYTRKINSITGDNFGYITHKDRNCLTWSDAFFKLIEDVLLDGIEAGVKLPVDYDFIFDLVRSRRNVLTLITTPKLIHKDLWAGNIFVNTDTMLISGIVDCERALWADPLMEFIFGFLEDNNSFNEGYGRNKCSSEDELSLKLLYNLYFYLILIIECKYRLYPTDDQENWARKMLEKELEAVK